MFVYCGNDPSNCFDPTGCLWQELLDEFIRQIQDKSGYFTFALATTQADSPAPGPADIIGLGMAAVGLAICAGVAVYTTLELASNTFMDSSLGKKNYEKGLNDIASSFGNLKCVEATECMAEYLRRNGQKAEIITITYTGGFSFIWSVSKCKVISENYIHVGLLYNGIVYCNVHPYGLPESSWIADFDGTGNKYVTKVPI